MLRHLDASAVVDLWDNYPLNQFPAIWDWFIGEFASGQLAITSIALDEVGHRVPDCKTYLESNGIIAIAPSNDALLHAAAIKSLLGIVNEQYGGGVDENDIIIIAVAKVSSADLVTNEKVQVTPHARRNSKMPAVCMLPAVGVATIRLIDLIRLSGRVFG